MNGIGTQADFNPPIRMPISTPTRRKEEDKRTRSEDKRTRRQE
jgi:hypothetical protein